MAENEGEEKRLKRDERYIEIDGEFFLNVQKFKEHLCSKIDFIENSKEG